MATNTSEYQGYSYSFVFDFEKNHDVEYHLNWMIKKWHYSIYMAIFYLVGIYALQLWMRNKQPWNVRRAMVTWNIVIAFFSICGMYRAIPEIAHVLWNFGFTVSVCNNKINSVMGFWAWAFTMSKAVELLETTFIVLVKRKLSQLQVGHHAVTLMGSWFSFVYQPSLARWTIGINFTIHAIMYTYFAFKTSKIHVPEFVSMFITLAQIIQMVVGLAASFVCFWLIITGTTCSTPLFIPLIGSVVYTYFLYLFRDFYSKRYGRKNIAKKGM